MLLKKQVDKSSIEKVEAEIERLKGIVSERREASKPTKEGRDAALKDFKDYRQKTLTLREECFYQTNHVKLLRATEYSGEITALNYVISVLENPDVSTYVYRAQIAEHEKTLENLKKYPVREDD